MRPLFNVKTIPVHSKTVFVRHNAWQTEIRRIHHTCTYKSKESAFCKHHIHDKRMDNSENTKTNKQKNNNKKTQKTQKMHVKDNFRFFVFFCNNLFYFCIKNIYESFSVSLLLYSSLEGFAWFSSILSCNNTNTVYNDSNKTYFNKKSYWFSKNYTIIIKYSQ